MTSSRLTLPSSAPTFHRVMWGSPDRLRDPLALELRPESQRRSGLAKNHVIFPIASARCPKTVALLKSEHEPVRSTGSYLNALDTLRGRVVRGQGGFDAFRDKTTL